MSFVWLREVGGAIELRLQAQPGARRTEIVGVHGDALKIRLAAPPIDGRANDALVRFLAASFGVALKDVVLVRGHASQRKVVRIERPRMRPDRGWPTG